MKVLWHHLGFAYVFLAGLSWLIVISIWNAAKYVIGG